MSAKQATATVGAGMALILTLALVALPGIGSLAAGPIVAGLTAVVLGASAMVWSYR